MTGWPTLTTTFLASSVEAIEMVTIVVGVGAVRGWRSTLIGAVAGFVLLLAIAAGLGTALTAVPIDALRLVVGALLLVFGIQWLRKGVWRVAERGFSGDGDEEVEEAAGAAEGRFGLDWTAFVLAFKGVLLEGLEIAFIIVTFGAASGHLGLAAVGGVSALLLLLVLGAVFHGLVARVPRSVLMLAVGLLLSSFGTFWAGEAVGVHWPGEDLALVGLVGIFAVAGAALIVIARAGALYLSTEGAHE
jgi:uncharacterized membrane protein